MTRIPLRLVLLLLAWLPVTAAAQGASRTQPGFAPTLVVVLTVDQLRMEDLDRLAPYFTGGFKRLLSGGAVFTNAFHDHATTETAPGHSAILSGRFPRSTGIVRNNAGVGDTSVSLIGSPGMGASPARFRGTTLVDWLISRNARTRALSVSFKDRAAILPIGRSKQHVYWYSSHNGEFTTSTFYRQSLPPWVQSFNAERRPHRLAGATWTPLRADTAFTYTIPADTTRAVASVAGTPWMDEITLAFALRGVRELRLGGGPHTDVLAISLSATDLIGHRYGPATKEINDQLLRLDRSLGVFFDSLFAVRDPSRVLVSLTSDHGVSALPERTFAGRPQGYGRVNLTDLLNGVRAGLAQRNVGEAFDFEYGMVFVDKPTLTRAGINADSLVTAFAESARRIPGVLRVDKVSELARADTTRDVIARRWLHSLPADLPVAAVVTLQPYFYWSSITYHTHGSPHDYDAKVPVILYGAPFRAGRYAEYARVVDLAPTLAQTLRVAPAEKIDGRVLQSALKTTIGAK